MSNSSSERVIVVNKPQSLRDLVQLAVQRHQTSGRQLAMMAQREGFAITVTTINHLKAGTYKSVPAVETIRAIAWLAGVSDEVAFTAAGQPVPGPPLADELPPGTDNLSPKSRKAVIEMLRVLIDLEASSHDDQEQPEANPSGERPSREGGRGGGVVSGQKTDSFLSRMSSRSCRIGHRQKSIYVSSMTRNVRRPARGLRMMRYRRQNSSRRTRTS